MGLGLLGCGDDPTDFEQARLAMCHSTCAGYERCGLVAGGCEAACAESYDPRGIRPSGLLRIAECLETQSCAAIIGDTALEPCFKREAAAEPLRDRVITYCESASRNYFRCDDWWPVEECTRTVSLWTDETLAAAHACHDLECAELDVCENAVFGDPP
jgi:hypothetical protein